MRSPEMPAGSPARVRPEWGGRSASSLQDGRWLALFAVLALGCGPQELRVSSTAEGCTDYDPASPPAEAIEVAVDANYVRVSHVPVYENCDGEFTPEVDTDGDVITVREYWTLPDDAGTCETCFEPTVTLKDPDAGKYELSWYVGDGEIPLDTVAFEVE
jgi:hypothetical protein